MINPHVICRATEKEAWAAHRTILEHEDAEASRNFVEMFKTGDTASWRGHTSEQWVIGGNNRDLLLMAAAPIVIDGQLHGAVVLQQSADQLLALRDRALSRLFNLTFIATAAAVIESLSPVHACWTRPARTISGIPASRSTLTYAVVAVAQQDLPP